MSQIRRSLLLAAVVGGTGFGSLVLAGSISPVEYYTEFNNAVDGSGNPVPVTIMSQGNHAKLTLDPITQAAAVEILPADPGGVSIASLGEVTMTLGPNSFTDTFNASFNLDIYQVLPGNAQGTFVGDATGTIISHANGGKLSTVTISYSPGSIDLVSGFYATTYTPFKTVVPVNQAQYIEANITQSVPLPAAVWGGMGLLGVMGALKATRNRRQA